MLFFGKKPASETAKAIGGAAMEGNKTEMSGLLEIPACKASCMYRSDRRNPGLPAAIQKIPLRQFSLRE